ncbi:hypothetical protein GALMADRAFT_142962 [Galerina marginata CBS 339.88]|uniref:Uncharacterized protein n=1 Tax=Galerina marginata (strain CBS 339.88) TaxID=685588 RepID=A0A067SP29_GALM3|nr:hypothetical protein GALMADRAFT_142962 [Galerina marginata CBS 339.88]
MLLLPPFNPQAQSQAQFAYGRPTPARIRPVPPPMPQLSIVWPDVSPFRLESQYRTFSSPPSHANGSQPQPRPYSPMRELFLLAELSLSRPSECFGADRVVPLVADPTAHASLNSSHLANQFAENKHMSPALNEDNHDMTIWALQEWPFRVLYTLAEMYYIAWSLIKYRRHAFLFPSEA